MKKNSICSEGIYIEKNVYMKLSLMNILASPNVISSFSTPLYYFDFFPEFSSILANKLDFPFLSLVSNARTISGSHTFCHFKGFLGSTSIWLYVVISVALFSAFLPPPASGIALSFVLLSFSCSVSL